MLVLGLADHVNCGSALVRDGQVIAAINDERLVREKMVFGVPRRSIQALLDSNGLSAKDVDAVAIATERQHLIDGYLDFKDGWFGLRRGRFKQSLFELASDVSRFRASVPWLDRAYYMVRSPAFARRRKGLRRILAEELGIDCPVHFLDHHYCHVASAYYTSGFRDATVFSIDGGGDGNSGSVYDVTDGAFEELIEIPSFDSLGNFYSYITQLCGFKAGRHEGKITGLAAYGEPRYVEHLNRLLCFRDGSFDNVGKIFFLSGLKELERILPDDFRHTDLARSVQVHAEQLVVDLVSHWVERTGHRNVALSGGVAGNVKINQRVLEIPEVESVYVHPGMSDEGLPVGAALAQYWAGAEPGYDADGAPTMRHVYLGPGYSDEEIQTALERHEVAATRHDDVEAEIARLLVDDKVVARFSGRMEYGPRALGNRTILYQAHDPSVQHWLNHGLRRTEFMPFAPIVMTEYTDKCFVDFVGARDTARFMTITFNCTPWMAETCPGVVHIDNTARPQLVDRDDNPSMHRILELYHAQTGIPCLINTSFNIHEEPIVCTPDDAIRAFLLGHLDYLAIGNWVALNPKPVERDDDASEFDAALERRGVVRRPPQG